MTKEAIIENLQRHLDDAATGKGMSAAQVSESLQPIVNSLCGFTESATPEHGPLFTEPAKPVSPLPAYPYPPPHVLPAA